jgi:PIN domain nuclease of toxin-antitoxin system
MSHLIDTHILLWWMADAPDLSDAGQRLMADPANISFVSSASIWEIQIKHQVGKLTLPHYFMPVLAGQAFEELAVTHSHAIEVGRLPMHHRDPFDRMLIAQAKIEGLILITHDRTFERYGVSAEYV